jgi:hypothetical protein
MQAEPVPRSRHTALVGVTRGKSMATLELVSAHAVAVIGGNVVRLKACAEARI